MAANLAGLFFMVTRKLKVKNVEVPFFKYLVNSWVNVLFLERETTRWTDSENTFAS